MAPEAERVRALEEEVRSLRESLAMLEGLLGSVPDFVVRTTLEHEMAFINHLAPGFTKEQALGTSLYAFTDPAYRDVMRETFDRVLATGEPGGFESVAAGAEGRPTDYYTRIGLVRKDGAPIGFSVVATDVTAIKSATRAIAERERRLELAARAADLGFWHWDAVSDVVSWDEVSCRHFGVPKEEGKTTYRGFLDRVIAEDRERIREEVDRSVASGHYSGLQFRTVTPAGESRWLMTAGSVEKGADGRVTGLVGCILDVTERRRLEERFQQAHRMDAVGQLAAGVAHNFNNLLASVLPALELTVREHPQTAELLDDVREAASRSAEVVRQLMAFAGGGALAGAPTPCDTVAVARRVVHLARSIIGRDIEVRLVASSSPLLAAADAGEVEHALMNLVLNARDALEQRAEGGHLRRIDVQVAQLPGGAAWVRIAVEDNGAGMSEETRRRAVEPFFTTKAPGRGTGLGLSSAYAMVKARGGRLQIDSTAGVGTAVLLDLPLVRAPDSQTARKRPGAGRGESILLVDDEPAVLRATAAALTSNGYRVRAEGDAASAIAAFERAPREFALVILDESMPGHSGASVLKRMRAADPEVRVLSFSGGTSVMEGASAHLAKPVSLDVLLATVRRVLDEG